MRHVIIGLILLGLLAPAPSIAGGGCSSGCNVSSKTCKRIAKKYSKPCTKQCNIDHPFSNPPTQAERDARGACYQACFDTTDLAVSDCEGTLNTCNSDCDAADLIDPICARECGLALRECSLLVFRPATKSCINSNNGDPDLQAACANPGAAGVGLQGLSECYSSATGFDQCLAGC
jgi:hypothetical protein